MPVMSSLNTMPNELWVAVFERMHRSDLVEVIRTSKRFRDLALRILYQSLVWNDPRCYANSLPLWEAYPDLSHAPRTLTIGVCKERPDQPVAIVEMDGSIKRSVEKPWNPLTGFPLASLPDAFQLTRLKPDYAASATLYHSITQRILSFPRLRNLIFKKAILPHTIYLVLHSIPSLRTLHIESCAFTADTVPPPNDHSVLPITELTLLDVEVNWSVIDAAALATAHNLRVLHCDVNAFVYQMFTQVNTEKRYTVPADLDTLDIHMPDRKFWPTNISQDPSDYIADLIQFLAMCPKVHHLSIGGYISSFTFPGHILPNLQFYGGPIAAAASFIGDRPVSKVFLRDTGLKLWEWTGCLEAIAQVQSGLHELLAVVPRWDDEIIHAVVALFPELRKLHIKYSKGYVSEDTVMGIGPHFAGRLPHLETLHIFSPRMRSAAQLLIPKHAPVNKIISKAQSQQVIDENDERELKSLVVSWNRYCPNLREVQLLDGFVWRRADDRQGEETNVWAKRRYCCVDGMRSYQV